jgi:hypothetical protein
LAGIAICSREGRMCAHGIRDISDVRGSFTRRSSRVQLERG